MLVSILFLASLVSAIPAPAATASAAGAGFRFLGRVNPANKELTWPGTGVSFTFKGTTASVNLANIVGDNSFDLIIDGKAPTVISKVTATTISTPKLAQGTHTVVLRRRSETALGTVAISTVTTDGSFVAEKPLTRQIEIIGDSISVGYGLDGTNPCTNNAALTNNPKTYGVLAANALKADYSVIAWSGKGLVRNIATGSTDTSPIMPELWTRYGANDASNSYTFPASWKPSAVVINLGTNDWSYLAYTATGQSYAARETLKAADFTAALVKFVKSIQTRYPAAQFFLLSSPMLGDSFPTAADAQRTNQIKAVQDAVKQIGAKAQYVDWPQQGSDVGCDYHPNAATHAAEGKVLAAAIKATLKW
ncbi:SGNH hydrolase-type esterase domain-containing protein [Boeremia exigua]|uniref:SGNH hydrolase-type esterase domain-containing protein n=1 Tax=Boeremia exigua TaxID=749465 RepID=UPI001E8D4DE3|nr:SGNH hydrolase-type esterase domain-containing protein [Boeremia exigua]KAH6629141.1 SGNH hydrolase-type esterase domain-containing protein [Boeremia exigua]